MHPAPSLAEAPPKTDEPPRQRPESPKDTARHSQSASPPGRKNTTSSISTAATNATFATEGTHESTVTSCSVESSPTFSSQGVFSVKDGSDVSASRRANRRRTGPLSATQREKAALIRKVGACSDCRRRRVACHPNHHGMSWEDAMRKYRSNSPTMPELAPLAGRPLSPAPPSSHKPVFTHDPQEMEVDSPPSHPPGRPSISESRIRTPLPSGPRLDKPPSTPSPSLDSLRVDLQNMASRVLSTPNRNRYASVQGLFLHWQDDEDTEVVAAINELAEVLERQFRYTLRFEAIPRSANGLKSAFKWLSRTVNDFTDMKDRRDTLKIIYYNGYSFLDGNRDMVLASSKDHEKATTIRWGGIQQMLEESCSDTLLIMDAAYYPSSKMTRQQGVLELIAASASEEHFGCLGRGSFTRALANQLRTRATQKFLNPLSAADLHAKLLSNYPDMVQDKHLEKEILTSFPCPFHMQISGNGRLPSILLAPLSAARNSLPLGTDPTSGGPQLNMSIKLTDDALNLESWTEWFRTMPEGVREMRVEGPFRNTFR